MNKYSITAFGMEDIENKEIINVVNEALQSIDPLSNLTFTSVSISTASNRWKLQAQARQFFLAILGLASKPSHRCDISSPLPNGPWGNVATRRHPGDGTSAPHRLPVEVNSNIKDKRDVHLTIQAAEHLLQAVFGHQRRGNYPNDGTRQL
uniref:Uncharacterized protein n=1 Tax=Timema genevievae TaxID=629358 RepID=A0A7R9JWE4_TIMGE|nr:unnamed protein product [Timema genevievae]